MNSGTMAILLIILAFVIYFVCSSNGVKLFKKKEHKVKAKKSNEEKYADVLPKEKKEHKVKVAQSVEKEKLKEDIKKDMEKGKADTPAGKDGQKSVTGENPTVSKITKEDFLKNNIDVPKNSNWLTEEEKKKEAEVKALPKAKEQPSTSYDFGFDDSDSFPTRSSDLDDLFAGTDIDSILSGGDYAGTDSTDFPDLSELGIFDDEPAPKEEGEKYSQLASEDYFGQAGQVSQMGARSLEERFEEVFGKGYLSDKSAVAKEIIVGDVLSSPRAKVNSEKRKERRDRLKWM